MCSNDSGGSEYSRLLDRRLRPLFWPLIMMCLKGDLRRDGDGLSSRAMVTVGGITSGDSLTVFLMKGSVAKAVMYNV